MQHLGKTRSAHHADHLLQTPDTFVRAPLPGMRKATAICHIAAAGGAKFTQYTAEFEAGGTLDPSPLQRFVYVLDGATLELPDGSQRQFPTGAATINTRNVLHAGFKVAGDRALKMLTVHIVDKGKSVTEVVK